MNKIKNKSYYMVSTNEIFFQNIFDGDLVEFMDGENVLITLLLVQVIVIKINTICFIILSGISIW